MFSVFWFVVLLPCSAPFNIHSVSPLPSPPPPTTCGWLCTEQSVHTLTTVPCIKMNFRYKNSAIAMASFYDLAAKRLDGEMIKMEQYRGKVVLVENTASLWGTTVRDFTQMNELCEKVWWNDWWWWFHISILHTEISFNVMTTLILNFFSFLTNLLFWHFQQTRWAMWPYELLNFAFMF